MKRITFQWCDAIITGIITKQVPHELSEQKTVIKGDDGVEYNIYGKCEVGNCGVFVVLSISDLVFVYKMSCIEGDYCKSTVIREYIPTAKEDVEWRWEKTEGSWDGFKHAYMGFVPYINNVKVDVYKYIQGSSEMIMSSLLCDDGSYRLYSEHYSFFNLTPPTPVG